MRDQIRRNRKTLPDNVHISMDEWNVWYAWYRSSNVTDAIFAALTLHMLMCEAETADIAQACHFEAVNEGLIEVLPYSSRLTAQGEVFRLMSGHAGGRLCYESMEALATKHDEHIYLTAVNPSFSETRTLLIDRQTAGEILKAEIYTSEKVIPHSNFSVSNVKAETLKDQFLLKMPAHSVASIWFRH